MASEPSGWGKFRQTTWILWAFALLEILKIIFLQDACFFWDTVQLVSKQAQHFYDNGFQALILPQEIDSGHPPAMGILFASLWKIFGKSLWISHLAMLPFLLLNIWLFYQIGLHFLAGKAWLVPLFCLIDPVYAGQAALVSPDLLLTTFFLLGFWSILKNRPVLTMVAITGLALISMRGMMVASALFLFDVLQERDFRLHPKIIWRKLRFYLPGGILALLFLWFHFAQTGWIGYHENSPWADSFAGINWSRLPRNTVILGWRILDYGRFFLLATAAVIILRNRKNFLSENPDLLQIILLLGCLLPFLLPSMLLYENLLGHRYLLPILLTINILSINLIWTVRSKNKKTILLAAFLVLATGNLWVYPKNVAQGWDATLAHLPFYSLRSQALNYLDSEEISLKEVGTVFPQIGPLDWYDLNDRMEGMVPIDLRNQRFVLYANLMNDFTEDQLRVLEQDWYIRKQWNSLTVQIILYENPKFGL